MLFFPYPNLSPTQVSKKKAMSAPFHLTFPVGDLQPVVHNILRGKSTHKIHVQKKIPAQEFKKTMEF